MAAGRWRAGTSHTERAKKWRIPYHQVEKIAVAAGRHIRLTIGTDREALLGTMLAELGALCDEARRANRPGDAIRGIELRARLLHLIDPPKPNGTQPLTTSFSSAREALEFVRAMIPELEERAAREQIPALTVRNGGV